MKLYTAHRAPSPRRVLMFLVEKNITGIEMVNLDLNGGEHRQPHYLAKSPLAKVPALELDDGRVITETRAICTLLEGRYPEPNLMGVDGDERGFIEMADRQVELYLLGGIANAIRHSHPGWPLWKSRSSPSLAGRKPRRCATWPVALTCACKASLGSQASASALPTSPRFAHWSSHAA
jgi:glutathione S-transferase